jgi:hypothetical protein
VERPKFEFKAAELKQWESLQELHLLCFGQAPPESYFRWKYLLNPHGPLIGTTAWDGNQIAGFYGLIPERYRIQGKGALVYQSMDTMTHPKYQRMGLFSSLAKSTVQNLDRTLGDTPLMGVPGRVALPGFVKAGWHHCGSLQQHFQSPLVLRWQGSQRGLSVTTLEHSSYGWREYLQSRMPKSNEKEFSEKYFEWRVFGNPMRKLTVLAAFSGKVPVALAVFQKEERHRHRILFIEGKEESHPGAARALIIAAAQQLRGRWFYTWGGTRPERSALLRSLGFISNPFSRGPFSHRVPLILRSSKNDRPLGGLWSDWKSIDWQPLYQD